MQQKMRVTGASMSASSNKDLANVGVPTSENGEDLSKFKPGGETASPRAKDEKKMASPANSLHTLAVPTVDGGSVRQSASKLILKVDESGNQAF